MALCDYIAVQFCLRQHAIFVISYDTFVKFLKILLYFPMKVTMIFCRQLYARKLMKNALFIGQKYGVIDEHMSWKWKQKARSTWSSAERNEHLMTSSTARAIRMHRIRLLLIALRYLMSYGDHSAQRCFKSNAPTMDPWGVMWPLFWYVHY